MWGSVHYRRTLSVDSCKMAQCIAADHKKPLSVYQRKVPIRSVTASSQKV